jgi:hypothetical protein
VAVLAAPLAKAYHSPHCLPCTLFSGLIQGLSFIVDNVNNSDDNSHHGLYPSRLQLIKIQQENVSKTLTCTGVGITTIFLITSLQMITRISFQDQFSPANVSCY